MTSGGVIVGGVDAMEDTEVSEHADQPEQNYSRYGRFTTYKFHIVFDSGYYCLFQLSEFVIRCQLVWEGRAQTLARTS